MHKLSLIFQTLYFFFIQSTNSNKVYAVSTKRERRRLERKWKSSGDEQDSVKYRKHCRVTNKKIIGARQQFYRDRIKEAGKDPRRRWSVIHDVLHATSEKEVMSEDDCRRMSRVFAKYFVDKVRKVKCAITDRVSRLVRGWTGSTLQ